MNNIPDPAVDDYIRLISMPECIEPTDAQFIDWAQSNKSASDWARLVSESDDFTSFGLLFSHIAGQPESDQSDAVSMMFLRPALERAAIAAWFDECYDELNWGEE
jgi:hypothetical protein